MALRLKPETSWKKRGELAENDSTAFAKQLSEFESVRIIKYNCTCVKVTTEMLSNDAVRKLSSEDWIKNRRATIFGKHKAVPLLPNAQCFRSFRPEFETGERRLPRRSFFFMRCPMNHPLSRSISVQRSVAKSSGTNAPFTPHKTIALHSEPGERSLSTPHIRLPGTNIWSRSRRPAGVGGGFSGR